MNAPGPTREIGIVVFEDVLLLDVAGPADVFSRANAHLKVAGQPDRYRVTSISSYGGEIGASAGLRIQTAVLPNPSICALDTLLVAGGPGALSARHDLLLRSWLWAVEPRVRRIGSVCTGAFILAESGLLTDKLVTTHWNHAASFAQRYPQVRLDIDALYVSEGKIFSCAGATAAIDLALHLVDEDFGRELALAIARELVVFRVRSAGQAQYSAALASYGTASDRMRRATEFIRSHLHEDVTVEAVAAHVCLCERQLSRLFNRRLGMSPIQYIGAVRVDLARELLSGTQQPLEKIALRCGFSGRPHFTRVFFRNMGISPNEFRARFHP